jgi:hypothetical protein
MATKMMCCRYSSSQLAQKNYITPEVNDRIPAPVALTSMELAQRPVWWRPFYWPEQTHLSSLKKKTATTSTEKRLREIDRANSLDRLK